ncbi:MAG: hypothetical protein GQ558_08585 [Thermoplasmata archaeon]|nr:hypothetical protein [Thermoplasmata archaeon]
MKAPAKVTIVLVVLMMLSSAAPLLAAGGTGDGSAGESRENGGPLDAGDAMVEYAILTSFSFVSQFERLAQWKTEKGMYAKVYATDWVTNNYPGPDSRAQYHNFLRDLYNHTGGNLKYLLIGGDNEIVRSREIWTGDKGWEFSGPYAFSDHYYAGLDHDWDANGNGKYGEVLDLLWEPDWDAEISVGRAPVSNVQEASDVVDKFLAYEKDPEIGDWMRQAVMVSSVMNPPNTNATIWDDPSHIYNWWEDNAWESIQRTLPYIPPHMDRHIIYDYNQIEGGNYTVANDTMNQTSYNAAMSMGSSIFVSVTHGYIPSGNGLPHYAGNGIGYNWSRAFYYDDIPNLKNGNQTPFVYFSSCFVGNFTEIDDTNYERLLTQRYGGAIGFIAPSELTYRGEEIPGESDGNWWMSENFWKYLLVNRSRPGDAFYQMIRDYEPHIRSVNGTPSHPFFQQNHAAYNLIGDPEIPIWLDIPKQMTVVMPDEIFDLEYDVEVRVMEGAIPVEGARVCFKGEDFYAYADTDGDGWAVLHISPGLAGQSVTVTVTADQYLHDQQIIGVAPAPAELEVVARTIRAATDIPQAGVATTLSAEIRNIGHSDALSFSVQFYDGGPAQGGTPIGDPVDVPGLPADKAATLQTDWDSPTAGWHNIFVLADSEFEIEEVLEDNNWGSALVYVSAMNAKAASIGVAGAGGDTALPFGDEAEIAVTVEATGTEAVPPTTVRLYLGDPAAGGLPVGSDRTTSTIPAGGDSVVTFMYTPAQVGNFRLFAVIDPDGQLKEFDTTDNQIDLAIFVGHPPIWSPIMEVQMVEDNTKRLELNRYLTDYDNDIVDIEVTVYSVSTNRVTLTVEGLVLVIDPDKNWFGDFEVELQADDGNFRSLVGFSVHVEARNDAPIFNNTEEPPIHLLEGEGWYYVFDVYDPDGDEVFLTDNSELFDVTIDGIIDFTPSYFAIRYSPIHVFRVIATDGIAQSYFPMTLEFELVNTAPEMRLPEQLFAVEGQAFAFQVQAWDREDDPLTFTDDSDMFDIIPTTGQIMFTPTNNMVGKHNVTITVSDGEFEVNGSVEFYIYEAAVEQRDLVNTGWAVLAGQTALLIIGAIFLTVLIIRKRKKRADSEDVED